MKEKNSWDLVKTIGETKTIDKGGDSVVSSIKDNETGNVDFVAKSYDGLAFDYMSPRDPKIVEEILKEYHHDTESAKKVLEKNPNPLNQSVKINNETFFLKYKIISQGDFILEQEKRIGREQMKELIKSSVGQEFVSGLNMHLLVEYPKGSKSTKEQKVFVKNYELYQELTDKIMKVFSHLSQSLNVKFTYGAMNVKPFINKEEKTITMVITDLAASLDSYYNKSTKFKRP